MANRLPCRLRGKAVHHALRVCFILWLCANLGGCAALLGPREAAPPVWSFKGKLGYRTPGGTGSVLVEWRQFSGERFMVVLRTVMGVSVARLEGTPTGSVTLHHRGQEQRYADLGGAAQAALGTPVPLAELSYWVRGAPGSGPYTQDESGFTQAGWSVTQVPGEDGLPKRLVMRQGDVRFVLAIRSWQ